MKRFGPVLAAVLALASPRADAAPAADDVTAHGLFEILAPYHREYSNERGGQKYLLTAPAFPLDAALLESYALGYFDVVGPPWDPATDAGWVYANEAGRVRVIADNVNFHTPTNILTPYTAEDYRRELRTGLRWWKSYTKEPGATAKFTVNTSYLSVFHPHWYEPPPLADIPPTPEDLPYAKLSLWIAVHRPELPDTTPEALKHSEEFWARIDLVRDKEVFPVTEWTAGCVNEISIPHNIWRCESGVDKGVWLSRQDSPLWAYPIDWAYSYVQIETAPYTGIIDLTAINDGETYTIEYWLQADVGSYATNENYTTVVLGDPLDPLSGLSLEVSSPPAPGGKAPRLCDVEIDAARFTDHGDGTATDTSTGLVWQRCPAGYALDAGGTSGDMRDDRCVATSSVSPTWQGGLQYAAVDALAGHDDWRLPNVKELDSIVELGCRAPAIEPGPFPDTPSDAFWTSTPGRDGATAMAVGFATGAIDDLEKASQALVRLVRTGPLPPAPSLPGLRVGRPEPVLENDAGTASMVFRVVLDRPAATMVTVDYHTADDTAHAGADFVATSGTLVIPAGTRIVQVAVPILADGVGEPPETLYLVLDQVSPNARLAVAASSGAILDSQPQVEVAEAHVSEGDAGTADLAFPVTLSKPSSLDTTVSYATSDGTATAGDYTPASGTLTIPAGHTSAWVHVGVAGDTSIEGDEYLLLTLSGVSANAVLGPGASAKGYIVEDDAAPVAQALNDTGIGQCTDGSVFAACPQAAWPGQDGEHGRDVTQNVAGDGYRGFSFTKLDGAGVPLADQTQPYATAPWSCVRDEVTGLVWEVKTNDGGLHDMDWTYTWYDSTGINDGGSPGTPAGGVCVGAAGCDSEKFVAGVNAAGWCGATDWRLPGREELRSLVVAKDGGFLYVGDPPWFPNTPGSHWTSTPSIDSTRARYFIQATSTEGPKSNPQAVRLVRGGI